MPPQPTSISETTSEVVKKVILKNPFYRFRKAQTPKWSLRTAATFVGVTQQAVANWESGVSYPLDENIEAMAKVMNTTYAKLASDWKTFMQSRDRIIRGETNG